MDNQLQQLQKQVAELEKTVSKLSDLFYRTSRIDKYDFMNPAYFNGNVYLNNKIYLKDGSTVNIGATTGAIIGATGEKIGFLGHAPIARQAAITAPTGGATVDAQSRTAIGTIITVLQSFGLTS